MTARRSSQSTAARIAGSIIALGLLAGCATPPPESDPEALAEWEQVNDPLEPMNREIFAFNEFLDTYAIRPAAEGYRNVVPQFGRDRLHDALENLKSPLVFANDLLQGETDRAVQTFFRAAFNTTFGLLGFVDIATEAGIPAHEEDFGQTLAVWGIEEGPYLVLPLFGPSNPRDAFGTAVEWYGDPVDLVLLNMGYDWATWTRSGISGLDKRERLIDTLDDIKRTSLDYYASLRSLYRQHRTAEIANGRNQTRLSTTSTSGASSR
ncbi:MlaA family lipoprotein [Magnetospirillum molischianum]|uniref:Surface lipoprotein n=1 Tax=Magnetospirillum molischianum DSM 120 TaxID=1150626 RepID=H8FT61_MAGML|nr:VacJ family lipoprotein [Magnetospirillum molischianum]CCG41549.1 Surface lipoprotein [Magnetospirillum molischianum DSM 120]